MVPTLKPVPWLQNKNTKTNWWHHVDPAILTYTQWFGQDGEGSFVEYSQLNNQFQSLEMETNLLNNVRGKHVFFFATLFVFDSLTTETGCMQVENATIGFTACSYLMGNGGVGGGGGGDGGANAGSRGFYFSRFPFAFTYLHPFLTVLPQLRARRRQRRCEILFSFFCACRACALSRFIRVKSSKLGTGVQLLRLPVPVSVCQASGSLFFWDAAGRRGGRN